MKRWIEIPLAVYRLHVIVAWEMTGTELMRLARRRGVPITPEDWGRDFEEQVRDPRCVGLCMELGDDNSDVLVWLRHRPQLASDFAALAHELYHAVQAVSRARSLDGERESPAFLLEYLFMECSRVLWPAAKQQRA